MQQSCSDALLSSLGFITERNLMLIGAMNHPARPLLDEIKWMVDMGLDFIDLTLEPPCSAIWNLDVHRVRAVLGGSGLKVVGHTAYYLPLASPFESLRRAAIDEAKQCLELFAKVGAGWMNVHPDVRVPLHDKKWILERNLETLRELLAAARDHNVGLMVENLPGGFNTVEQLACLLEPLTNLGLHLDIGHTNLKVEQCTADPIIAAFGPRIKHVHLHDNKGGEADLHLPLGTGTLNTAQHIQTLKASGYDGTITLEVFADDPFYFAHSRDLLRRLWDEAPPA
jgi:sugar phosphate isomerase/epimerase